MSCRRLSVVFSGLLLLGACLDRPSSEDESTRVSHAHISRGESGFVVQGLVAGSETSVRAAAVTLDGAPAGLAPDVSPHDGICVICHCSASSGLCDCKGYEECPE
jgi:hypothetical protein